MEPYALTDPNRDYAVIHPLLIKLSDTVEKTGDRDISFGFYGYIKPYKNLHNILKKWPLDKPLTIKGYCQDRAYETYLESIIKQRRLQVSLENKILDDEEYLDLMLRTKVVVVTHIDNSIISSGMYYAAVSFGCNVLVDDSVFGGSKVKTRNYVHVFDESTNLDALIDVIVPSSTVIKQANESYGEQAVKQSWLALLAG